ncbi:MAG: hypothetical protein ABIZ80_02560 [Bryobacteraceae bacterium]
MLVLRTRVGQKVETSGTATLGDGPRVISQIRILATSISTDEKGRTIHIDGLNFGLRVPMGASQGGQYLETGVSTNIDVREGQKVVVGKANMEGPDKAMILVLMAKVAD